MGTNAALHLREVVSNVGTILAIELLCACQAKEYVDRPLPEPLVDLYATVREQIPALKKDEEVYEHIETAARLIWASPLGETMERSIDEPNKANSAGRRT